MDTLLHFIVIRRDIPPPPLHISPLRKNTVAYRLVIKIVYPYLVLDSDETIIQPIFIATINKTFDLQQLKNVLDTVLEFNRSKNNIFIDKLASFRR